MMGETSQVQINRTEIKQVNRRIEELNLKLTLIINALKKKKTSSLDKGLEELRKGKVHRYKSIDELVSDVWG